MFLGCRSFLCSGCFITCMEVHFPAVELNNAIRSINHFRVSWFLCHSSFNIRHFLLYSSGLEVLLARSLNTKPNHVTAMLQLHPSLNHQVKLRQLFWCILIDRYLTPAALSWTRGCLLNFPAKYVNLPENSAESLGSRTERCWGYVSIYENTPKKLPQLFGFGLFVLSVYLLFTCYLFDT